MRIIARLSPDLNWGDAVEAHPEWFERDKQDNVIPDKDDPRLFRTCMFSSYMTDYIPAIIREVTSLYDVDAVFTNGWPPLGILPVCYCAACRQLPPPGTPAFWAKLNDRVEYLWKFYDSLVKEKRPAAFYFANLGGGARSSVNLVRLGKLCEWFQGDNQGRGGEGGPFGCARCRAVYARRSRTARRPPMSPVPGQRALFAGGMSASRSTKR